MLSSLSPFPSLPLPKPLSPPIPQILSPADKLNSAQKHKNSRALTQVNLSHILQILSNLSHLANPSLKSLSHAANLSIQQQIPQSNSKSLSRSKALLFHLSNLSLLLSLTHNGLICFFCSPFHLPLAQWIDWADTRALKLNTWRQLSSEEGKYNIWYFFTCGRPNEVQSSTDGEWCFGEKKDIIVNGMKFASKQVLEYYESGQKSGYTITEYHLYPLNGAMETRWYLCKLLFKEAMDKKVVEARAEERKKLTLLKCAEKVTPDLLSLGFVFSPTDEVLLGYYLCYKNLGLEMRFCPIEEGEEIYANHPESLTGKKHKGRYIFTRSRFEENQSTTDVKGHWLSCKKEDIFIEGQKFGVKQVLEHSEQGQKSGFTISEYQLDSIPFVPYRVETGIWFLCKLTYEEVHG